MTIDALSKRLIDSGSPLRIHLIGVAGSGMSGLALLLIGMGHEVSGSDRVTSDETERMQGLGLKFSSPHSSKAVQDVDLVVFSSAIRSTNVARAEAEKIGVRCMCRAECLAAILGTKKGILISGTHGKTTTSAMSAHVMRRGAARPSHYVGAEIPVLGTNAHWDEEGDYMVAEGDESDGTIQLYAPEHTVVLNVEEEHLDFYERGLEQIKEVFTIVLNKTRGAVIYCGECEIATELCGHREGSISYGWSDADYIATNVLEQGGSVGYDVHFKGENLGRVELGVPGRHNVLNSLAAIAVAKCTGVSFNDAARALATFAGAKRRFETKYLSNRLRVVDDYGHHPTEVAATLQTARSLGPKRIVVLFQPHRFSRTQKLSSDFGEVLQAADAVYVSDIYPASEEPIPGITGQTIVDAMAEHGRTPAKYVGAVDTAHHVVGNALKEGDMLITLGAGNIHEAGTKVARDMAVLEELERAANSDALKTVLYEPMRKHTTILVGGPAQFWVEPRDFEACANAVKFCRDRGVPVRFVGRGSNLLVRGGGIRGAVIHPNKGDFTAVTVEGNLVKAGAGARFKKVASVAMQHGLTGFEWMEGIPGNVGGGLRMNAGAMGTETFDQVVAVTFLDEDGDIRTRNHDEIEAFYRNVPELRRNFALCATFRGSQAPVEEIQQLMEKSKTKRQSSQPVAASAGCIFKNPLPDTPAGLLVDQLGMKDVNVGKARVSTVHGNFIVNEGGASSEDVLELIEVIRDKAKAEHGLDLETEVQILGEDEVVF